jgi:hypothetical protein
MGGSSAASAAPPSRERVRRAGPPTRRLRSSAANAGRRSWLGATPRRRTGPDALPHQSLRRPPGATLARAARRQAHRSDERPHGVTSVLERNHRLDPERGRGPGEPRVGDHHDVALVKDRLGRGEVDRVVAAERTLLCQLAGTESKRSVSSIPSISAQSAPRASAASRCPAPLICPERCAAASADRASARSATDDVRNDAWRQASRARGAPRSSTMSLTNAELSKYVLSVAGRSRSH